MNKPALPRFVIPTPRSIGLPVARTAAPMAAPMAAAEEAHPQVTEAISDEGAAPVADHARVKPVFSGYGRLLPNGWTTTDRGGMAAGFRIMADSDVNPFKGLRCKRLVGGHRLRLVLSHTSATGVERQVYLGEALLCGWGDNDRDGMTVRVRLDDGPDGARIHPLDGFGEETEFYMACWAVADDEQPEDPELARRASRPFTSLGPAQQSHVLCRDPLFQRWCREVGWNLLSAQQVDQVPPPPPENSGAYAAAIVKAYCGIQSRKEFSPDTAEALAARQAWGSIYRNYMRWKFDGR